MWSIKIHIGDTAWQTEAETSLCFGGSLSLHPQWDEETKPNGISSMQIFSEMEKKNCQSKHVSILTRHQDKKRAFVSNNDVYNQQTML